MASVSVNSYDQGDVVRIEGSFAVGATPTNPTLTTLKVEDPAGAVTTHTIGNGGITNPTTGLFRRDHPLSVSGEYWYRFEGTGAAEAAEEGRFYVRERQVA